MSLLSFIRGSLIPIPIPLPLGIRLSSMISNGNAWVHIIHVNRKFNYLINSKIEFLYTWLCNKHTISTTGKDEEPKRTLPFILFRNFNICIMLYCISV